MMNSPETTRKTKTTDDVVLKRAREVWGEPLNDFTVYDVLHAKGSPLDAFLTFTPLLPGTTRLNVSIFDEVLNAVNAVRAANGDPPVGWASILPPGIAVPAPRVRIRQEHLSALRGSMNAARFALGFPPLSFAQPGVRGQVVRTTHVLEIRGGIE